MAEEQDNWGAPAGGDGPRPYRMEIEEAEFAIMTNRDGEAVSIGGTGATVLRLAGPTMYLNADDFSDDEEAEASEDEDYPIRSHSVGTFDEFVDEDENGESIVAVKKAGIPRPYWELGQMLQSMLDNFGGDWLRENFGDWTQAETWVGHTIVVHRELLTDSKGDPLMTKPRSGEPRRKTWDHVLAIDDVQSEAMGGDGKKKGKKKKKK